MNAASKNLGIHPEFSSRNDHFSVLYSRQQYANGHEDKMNELTTYLSQCDRSPGCNSTVKELRTSFLASLPANQRSRWNRGRFIAELGKAGFPIGTDCTRTLRVAGIAPAAKAWMVDADGRMVSA